MKRRRGLVALFALIALVFSLAETAFAATCDLGEMTGGQPGSHAQHDGMPAAPAPDHDSHQSMPDCPMSLAANCTAPASVQSEVTVAFAPAQEAVLAMFSRSDVVDHVILSVIFHPPRF